MKIYILQHSYSSGFATLHAFVNLEVAKDFAQKHYDRLRKSSGDSLRELVWFEDTEEWSGTDHECDGDCENICSLTLPCAKVDMSYCRDSIKYKLIHVELSIEERWK